MRKECGCSWSEESFVRCPQADKLNGAMVKAEAAYYEAGYHPNNQDNVAKTRQAVIDTRKAYYNHLGV